MKRYEKPKCTHAFILHSFPMIKSLPKVSILYPFGPLMNFWIYTWDSLPFKPISHLTMVCYHQNLIRRTLGLTHVTRCVFSSGWLSSSTFLLVISFIKFTVKLEMSNLLVTRPVAAYSSVCPKVCWFVKFLYF